MSEGLQAEPPKPSPSEPFDAGQRVPITTIEKALGLDEGGLDRLFKDFLRARPETGVNAEDRKRYVKDGLIANLRKSKVPGMLAFLEYALKRQGEKIVDIETLEEIEATWRSKLKVQAPATSNEDIVAPTLTDVAQFAEFVGDFDHSNHRLSYRRNKLKGFYHLVQRTTEPTRSYLHREVLYVGDALGKTWLVTQDGEVYDGFCTITPNILGITLKKPYAASDFLVKNLQVFIPDKIADEVYQCGTVQATEDSKRVVNAPAIVQRIPDPSEAMLAVAADIEAGSLANGIYQDDFVTNKLKAERIVGSSEQESHKPNGRRYGSVVVNADLFNYFSELLKPSPKQTDMLMRGVWKPFQPDEWSSRVEEVRDSFSGSRGLW